MEWNGMEWNGMEWRGMDGMEWKNGMDWKQICGKNISGGVALDSSAKVQDADMTARNWAMDDVRMVVAQ